MPDIVSSIGAALVCPTSHAAVCASAERQSSRGGSLAPVWVKEELLTRARAACGWRSVPVAMLASRLVRVLTAVAVCVALFVAAEGAGGVITAAVTRDMEKVRLPCVV